MSWVAMNYVRRLRREFGVNGNDRYVASMIALRIPRARMESAPVSHGELADDTGLDRKTVKACVKRVLAKALFTLGQAGGGRGNAPTYVMPALAGPLFSMAGGDGGKGGAGDPLSGLEKGGDMPPFDDEKGGAMHPFGPERGAPRPAPVRTSTSRNRVRTKTTSTAAKPAAAETYAQALDYLDWFASEHPKHRNGAQVSVDIEVDGPIVVKLLTSPVRSVERLQQMAIVEWTVTVAEDPWLARAVDRGIRLLAHAADRLDGIVAARCARTQASPVDAGQGDREALRAAIAQLEACSVPLLKSVCAMAAERLCAPAADIEAIDRGLLDAARQCYDLAELEAQARRVLGGLEARLGVGAFSALVAKQVDQLVRERAGLPDLVTLLAGAVKVGVGG